MHYGFTLTEVLISIAVLSIFAALGSYFGISSYVKSLSSNDAELLRAALERARAEAGAGICDKEDCTEGMPHGVHVLLDEANVARSVVVFEGPSYDSRDVDDDVSLPFSGESLFGGDSDVVFSAGAAYSTKATMILQIGDVSHTTHISVTPEGQISLK